MQRGVAALVMVQMALACTDVTLSDGSPWHDSDGPQYTCAWYAAGSTRCSQWGGDFANEGHTANTACCTCGGGIPDTGATPTPPASTPTPPAVTPTPPAPTPTPPAVTPTPPAPTPTPPAATPTPPSSCTDRTLSNGSPWHDSDGTQYTCAWYAGGSTRCSQWGGGSANEGHTANTACCVCGGGVSGPTPAPAPTPAPTPAPPSSCGPRVRRAWSQMDCAARQLYLSAVSTFKTSRSQEFTDIVTMHLTAWDYAHFSEEFLPWHRWYLIGWENALRSLGGEFACITLPFWDWERDADSESNSDPLRSYSFGSSSGVSGGCVTQGIVATPGWAVSNGGCLERSFGGAQFSSEIEVSDLIIARPTYTEFRSRLESNPHAAPHIYVGGHMAAQTSPEDPLFMLHHANVDRMWAAWQDYHGYDEVAKSAATNTHYNPASVLDTTMPFPITQGGPTLSYFSDPVTIRDMLHIHDMPYGTSFSYAGDNLAFVLGTTPRVGAWSWFTPQQTTQFECTSGRSAALLEKKLKDKEVAAALDGLKGTSREKAIDSLARKACESKKGEAISPEVEAWIAKMWKMGMKVEKRFMTRCGILE